MKTLYKYLALSVLITAFYACKKELGALPKNAKVDANTVLDQGTAQIALNGAYYCFANASRTKTNWQDHQITPAELAGHMGYGYGGFGSEAENKNATINSFYWDESYVLINAANGVIKGITALPDEKFTGTRKKEMLAEARFLRAYGHFKILIWYAEWKNADSRYGVLLRDELSVLGNISKARSSVKESYDFILADLDNAIENGPVSNPNVYVTKWAAMALKMRVLISRGTSDDYTEIISLAKNIIDHKVFTLEANAQDIFRTKGLSSKEVILGVKPQANQQLDYYAKSAQYTPEGSGMYVATPQFKNLFYDDNDPRKDWMVTDFENTESDSQSFYFTKYMSVKKDAGSGELTSSVPTVVSETDYALRLTEVYLLMAEASAHLPGGLANAKIAIHTIQEKAGITSTANNAPYMAIENADANTILYEIYKETVKSLVAEDGMEWMALLRLPFEKVQQLKPTIVNKVQFILPIPKSVFMYNPTFGDQNPGYSKN